MQTFEDRKLEKRLQKLTGSAPIAPARFYSFQDLEATTWEQVQRVKSHPWIPKDIPVRRFIYDVRTGGLREVVATRNITAT